MDNLAEIVVSFERVVERYCKVARCRCEGEKCCC